LIFLVTVAAQWRLLALTVLASWTALGFTFVTLFHESGLMSHTGRGWAGLSVLVLAGLAAVGLSRRSSAN
jgi:hypothetical protein